MSCDFLSLANAGVQGLIPYQPGKPMAELERELGLEHIVKLASNENPLGPSSRVKAAIEQALEELTRYPDGNGFTLKQKLCSKHHIELAQITLGNAYERGQGVPQDYVSAYMWFNLTGSNGSKVAVTYRNNEERKMSKQQIEKAQEMARNWEPTSR